MGRDVHGANCPWGELSVGRIVHGREMSVGRAVHGANCPWGELSVGRDVVGRVVVGRVVVGRVSMGRVVREPVKSKQIDDVRWPIFCFGLSQLRNEYKCSVMRNTRIFAGLCLQPKDVCFIFFLGTPNAGIKRV
jgi:hypothetical protein